MPDQVVTDTGKGDDVNPRRVVASLLEGGRDEAGRNVGVEGVDGLVIAAGRGNGAGGRVGGQSVEGTLVRV